MIDVWRHDHDRTGRDREDLARDAAQQHGSDRPTAARSDHEPRRVLRFGNACQRSDASEAVVVSGFGPRAQWYRNVVAGGAEEVRIGRRRFEPEVRELPAAEAIAVLASYERRIGLAAPLVRAVLSRLAGFRYDGSSTARQGLVETLPFIAFVPRSADQ